MASEGEPGLLLFSAPGAIDAMKQAGGDKDKDKGDKKGDGKPKVLKLCDVTDLCGFCGAGSCKFKCAKCHLVSYCSDQCQFRDITKHQPDCKSLEEQAHHRALNEAFLRACFTGILRLVKTMLEERGADANYVGTDQYTPLIAASGGGHVPVVEALIAADSKVDYARREDGSTALLVACEQGHVDVVRILLRAGANPNQVLANEGGTSALMLATVGGFVLIVNELISAGANVNYARPSEGYTALFYACEEMNVPIIRSLLRAGAFPNLNLTDETAHSPLMQASSYGNAQSVDELISAGANVNYVRQFDGCTCLIIAAQNGFVDVVRSLLAAGADPRTADSDGDTPMSVALECEHTEIVELLAQALGQSM